MASNKGNNRNQHESAIEDEQTKQLLDALRSDWSNPSAIERGERIQVLLRDRHCSMRGIGKAIGVDKNTIRHYGRISELPADQRERIDAGAPPLTVLRESRAQCLGLEDASRLEREKQDGTHSDHLADRLVSFMSHELPGLCTQPYLNQLFWEGERGMFVRVQAPSRSLQPRSVPAPVSPQYALGLAIRMARPDPKALDISDFEYAIQWLENLAFILEPVAEIREAGFHKALLMLRKAAANTAELIKRAAHSSVKGLGEYLRSLPNASCAYPYD